MEPWKYDSIRESVISAAAVGCVRVNFHERKKDIQKKRMAGGLVGMPPPARELYDLEVIADVYSDNQGSVNAFCAYLAKIAQSLNTVVGRTREYKKSVTEWCNAERKPA